MYVHSGERPFQCNTCGSRFTQKGTLKRHTSVHSGEKPFECKIHSYKGTQKGSLKIHIRIHSGEKPLNVISCNMYDYIFAQRCNLQKNIYVVIVTNNFGNISNKVVFNQ